MRHCERSEAISIRKFIHIWIELASSRYAPEMRHCERSEAISVRKFMHIWIELASSRYALEMRHCERSEAISIRKFMHISGSSLLRRTQVGLARLAHK
jgi:hypothetical protein